MSTDPVNDQFAFVREEPPPLLVASKSRRSSPWRRRWIAVVFISLDVAILACALHLLRVVAIPGLPAMDAEPPAAETKSEAAEPTVRTASTVTPAVRKPMRPRDVTPPASPKTAESGEKKPAESAAAEETPPEAVLEGEGLKRAGDGYLLSDEQDWQKRLERSRVLFKQTHEAFVRLRDAARDFTVLAKRVQNLKAQRVQLKAAIDRQQEFVRGLPRTTNVDKAYYDEQNGLLADWKSDWTEVDRLVGLNELELPGVAQTKNQAYRAYKSKESEFLSDARRLERTFDSRIEEYASLAKDPKIKKSIEAVGQKSGKNLKLSPSQELLSGRDGLKKSLKTVESTEVPEP